MIAESISLFAAVMDSLERKKEIHYFILSTVTESEIIWRQQGIH